MSGRWMKEIGRTLGAAVIASSVASAVAARTAAAEVRHTGPWDDGPRVSIDLDQVPRADAVKRVAEKAGWSVLLDNVPVGAPVDMHLRAQPAGKVIELLLRDGRYTATLEGTMLVIKRDAPAAPADDDDEEGAIPPIPPGPPPAGPPPPMPPSPPGVPGVPVPPVPPVPPTPPVPPSPVRAGVPDHPDHPAHAAHPHEPGHDDADADDEQDGDEEQGARGHDREVLGANLRIEKDEVVNDVNVVGGNADVYGDVTGDLMVTGGNVHVHPGARVRGDVTAMGGSITVDDNGRIDGDVDAIGGTLNRAKGAEIRGDVKVDQRRRGQSEGQGPSTASRLAEEAGNAITLTALLFVFGAILISFTSDRMEKLRTELAARPMRSIAAGIVAVVTAIAVFLALCVTIVGIPFALIGLFMAFVAVAAGLSSALETLGGALLAHRTRNPYAHLALGCLLFLVLGAIPFVGGFVKGAAVLAGIGTVALTRGAGLFAKNRPSGSPYREAPVG